MELLPDGKPDYEGMERAITPEVRMVYVQRSRGYSLRPSLFVEEIERIAAVAKRRAPGCVVMVDNCYGEFAEREEPTSRGADLMAGSFIKNPGGGIAPAGGYIAGRAELVEQCSYRLTAPGVEPHPQRIWAPSKAGPAAAEQHQIVPLAASAISPLVPTSTYSRGGPGRSSPQAVIPAVISPPT